MSLAVRKMARSRVQEIRGRGWLCYVSSRRHVYVKIISEVAIGAIRCSLGCRFPLFLVIDKLVRKQLCVPFGPLVIRKRSYSALFREHVKDWDAIGNFCAWPVNAGRQTEQMTKAWAQSVG